MRNREYFKINTAKYVSGTSYEITKPASLNKPSNHALIFVTKDNVKRVKELNSIHSCLILWPECIPVEQRICKKNAIKFCEDPHLAFCEFFQENEIDTLPKKVPYKLIDGAYIAEDAYIGNDVTIMPGAYIGPEARIGDNVFIGSGVKIIGQVTIGNKVIIRENSVIGADGLTTDRNFDGKSVIMPQFGDVIIEDDVRIGANTVIARGAIDSTIVHEGCRIDNQCFISHNVEIGNDTFIVGETIMFGSSSTGNKVMISGNSTIRNGVFIDDQAFVGMGSVVVKDIGMGEVVKGNPAK